MIIQGTKGTGKSYLIGAISQALENAEISSPSPLLLLAPTGVATFNIGASTPVARSVAMKVGSVNIVEDCSSDELELELLISKNSSVMLTSNLWIQASLVNGALGYIRKIVYKPGSAPPEPPSYVMVEFDNYS
ncbi:uncharacterized protein LOC131859208 [Cryptomeria japonica]|uniref:uncharacterized protein LOC131859208 n=1 Tax=Cryptomeria japonica TaxID=3369 RepID=UPI0027D9E1B1|nr:uncharacterized protein LOC131859208 [Cryptomeria japonica]